MKHVLHIQKLHGLLAHSSFLFHIQSECGGKNILMRSHVLCYEYVVKYRQVGEKTDVLECTGNAQFCNLVGRFSYYVCILTVIFAFVFRFHLSLGMIFYNCFSVESHKSVCRFVNACYTVERRCFSGSVGAYKGNYFVFVYIKRKVVYSNYAAELHRYVFNMKYVIFHQFSPPDLFAFFLVNFAGILFISRPRPSQENSLLPIIPLR